MRTARASGVSVTALATQYGVHRGTVWAKTRVVWTRAAVVGILDAQGAEPTESA